MSITGVFTKGRPAGHANATSILKYIPRARVPWQPSRFSRANLDEADLAKLWGQGRYRTGYGNYNSGYSTDKTHVLEDHTVNMIPKHELEKYMPDISIGSKALVTPVSLMSARNGHRVTHDMIHSYDPYIGRVQKPAVVDHDNITVEDPNRAGLNAATLDCRGRIYRWLRRGPFFQEDFYFRRSTALTRNGPAPVSAVEAPLMAKIVRLASRGHLKAACEEYRRITSIPPVAVYRALTAACVPGAKIADAVAIFEDGNTRLFYVARDGEVLYNLMRCAIRAKHRVRVMWVFNMMRGRHYENVVVRAEVGPIWSYRIASLALEYLLDHHAAEEARAVYAYLVEAKLIDCDVHARLGQRMQEALAAGKTVSLKDADALRALALVHNSEAVAPQVAAALHQRFVAELRAQAQSHDADAEQWARHNPLPPPPSSSSAAVQWLEENFTDVNVMAVLRAARFRRGKKDLMAKDRAAYVQRAAQWVELLSDTHQRREEAPLPYLHKSRPSLTNPNVRVAWLPGSASSSQQQQQTPGQLLSNEEGYCFYFAPQMRFVEETFSYAGSNALQARYLAQRPHHREVPAATLFHGDAALTAKSVDERREPARVLHSSVHAPVRRVEGGAAGSSPSAIAAHTRSRAGDSDSAASTRSLAPSSPADGPGSNDSDLF